MPRVPRIQPTQTKLTNQVPGRQVRSLSSTGDVVEILGQAGEAIFNQLRISNAIAEKTRAQNSLDISLRDISTRAEQDSDTSDARQKSYDEEIRKAQETSVNLISLPEQKSLFEIESQNKSDIARNNIQGFFRKKIVEQSKIELETYFDNKENEFVQSTNIGFKNTAILERNNKIDEAVAAGYMTQAEGTKRINELNEEWKKAQLDYDISVDPALARENIVAGNYDLTAKEEKAALTLAKDLEKRRSDENARIAKEDMLQNEIKLYNEIVAETKSIKDINDAETRGTLGLPGGISKAVATNLRRLATKGNVSTPEEQATSFIALQDRYTNLNFKEKVSLDDLALFRNDVVEALSRGEISKTVGEKWLKDTSEVLDEKLRDEVGKRNPRAGWNALKFWVEGLNPEEKDQMKEKLGNELMNRVSKGENDIKAANDIIEEETKKFNPNRATYEIGQIVNTPQGDAKVVGFDTDGEPLVELTK